MLVPVPWQQHLRVHRDLLTKLEQIQARLGRAPLLYGPNSGWRSHTQQKALWDAYQAGKGPVASNPDTGNRTHMRGVAADLRDTSQAMQRACVAVGLQRDPAEAWHWQLPDWRGYPIIRDLPTPEPEEDDMAQGAFYRNKTTGGIFWQEKPNTALIPISLPTWVAYAANGNRYADLDPKDIDGLLKKWGEEPAPTAGTSGAPGAAEIRGELTLKIQP